MEQNYDIYDRELLAIIQALKEWRPYLTGTEHLVVIIMDLKNLGYFKQTQNLTQQQAQWWLFLQEYDIKWEAEHGINMGLADMLSRKDKINTSDDNQEITLLKGKDQYFHIWAIDATLIEKINQSSATDPIITKALVAMNDETGEPWIPRTAETNWEFENGELYFKHQLYVPEPAHHNLVKSLHELLARGHEGFFCMLHYMQKDYWWPRMSTFLWKFILGCANCQVAKTNTHPMIPRLSPLAVENPLRFSSISVNLIMGLPDSHSFDSVMVMVDYGLMKGVIYCPCTKNINTAGVTQLFFTHVFPWFSLHSKVISDRGPQFASAFTQELACLLQYNVTLSTTYHPQTNWELEWVNQELETYLRLFTSNKPEEWLTLLPMAEFAHNSTTHSITQRTPFSLMIGYKPWAYPPLGKTFLPNLESQLLDLSAAQDDAQATHKVAQQKMKEWISSKFTTWKVRDKVWLKTTNLHMNGPKKLQMKWTSPFEVEEVISHMAFHLQIPSWWKIHPVFHTFLLMTYKETLEHGPNFLQLPPDLIDGEEEYDVEAVLRYRGRSGHCTFLIRWKGYSTAEDMWEPEQNLGNTQPLIMEYKITQPQDFPEYNHHHKARKWK